MPGGDGTGPMRQGPMTGGGFGRCGAGSAPGAQDGIRGRGGAFGRGQGQRNRRWAPEWSGWRRTVDWVRGAATRSPDVQPQEPYPDLAALESELQRLRTRIEELEATSKK